MNPSGKMCTQLWRRDRYADGAGKLSVPLVEYVRMPEVKGSMISGDLGLSEGEDGPDSTVNSEDENGCEDRRRIACDMVGWKSPPYCEYFVRCTGSVWPNEKNVEVALLQGQNVFSPERIVCYHLLVLETQIMTRQTPSMVVWIECISEWQNSPHKRIIETGFDFKLVSNSSHLREVESESSLVHIRTCLYDLILSH